MRFGICLVFSLMALPAMAGDVTIVDARATQAGDAWTFDVTLAHEDTGWDHYADAWRIVDAKGNVLGTRALAHPHENEQPFTRSLSGVVIPPDLGTVYIEAHDKVHGWAPEKFELELAR